MRAIPLLLVLASTAHAQDAEVRAFLERVKPPVLLTRPGMEAVRVRSDLVYQDGPKQKADVYAPPRARKPAPIVIFIHGGMGPEFPVRPKEWGIYQSWGRLMAASGLTAIVFNHRAGFPKVELAAATADLRDVVSWARAQARSWNADPERICLLAFSGGGPLLSFAMREPASHLRCQVGVYPILDIENLELTRGQMTAAELAEHSPVAQLSASSPPLLVVRAGKDSIPGLLAGLDRFVRVALEKNAALTLVNHPEAPHGFDNKLDTPRTREVLESVLGFVHAHLSQ
jgi:acetyl esterase/lipase